MYKRTFLLLLTFTTTLLYAQIEQIDSHMENLTQLQETNKSEITFNNNAYPFFTYESYENVQPFNLRNHQLYCVNDHRSEHHITGPAVIVLTL